MFLHSIGTVPSRKIDEENSLSSFPYKLFTKTDF